MGSGQINKQRRDHHAESWTLSKLLLRPYGRTYTRPGSLTGESDAVADGDVPMALPDGRHGAPSPGRMVPSVRGPAELSPTEFVGEQGWVGRGTASLLRWRCDRKGQGKIWVNAHSGLNFAE
jgi:hypothetical protein